MKTDSQTRTNRGFTLVELLIVIAIILALAGLTIVAVRIGGQAADAGRVTQNMKNIYNALTLMKSEGVNTGYHAPGTFPPYEGSLQDGSRPEFVWWDLVAQTNDIAKRDNGDFRWLKPYSETDLQNPLSDKKLGQGKEEYDSLIDEKELSFGGYAYNAQLGDAAYADRRMDRIKVIRDNVVQEPASTIFFAEAADTREEGDTTPGWVYTGVKNAPQGNYKDSAHCCMISGNIDLIKNKDLKDPNIFAFLTDLQDKNYDHQP